MGESRRFEWIKTITASGLDGYCKSILVTGLSMHMTKDGEHCEVGIDRIARETSWGRRTVQERLHALDGHFVELETGGGRYYGKKGRTNTYRPIIPDDIPASVRAVKEALKGAPGSRKGAPGAPLKGPRVRPTAIKGAPGAPETVVETVVTSRSLRQATDGETHGSRVLVGNPSPGNPSPKVGNSSPTRSPKGSTDRETDRNSSNGSRTERLKEQAARTPPSARRRLGDRWALLWTVLVAEGVDEAVAFLAIATTYVQGQTPTLGELRQLAGRIAA